MKIRHDYNNLQKYCQENNIKLLKDYSEEKINLKTKIEGKCVSDNCENYFEKKFIQIIKTGGYCKKCTEEIRMKKIENTTLERYGVTNANKNRDVRIKIEETNLKKYGVKYILQNKEIKEKSKQTCLKNNGTEYPMQSKNVKEKSKQTCLKNNGTEYPMQSKKVQKKSKKTCLKNYGVENPSKSEEIQNKIKNTFIKNYGCHPLQCKEIQEKCKNTFLKNHGVENSFQSEEIREKIKKTCFKNHGVENPFQSKEMQEKIKQTCLKNHGVENPFQSKEMQEKSKQTCLEKYGVEYYLQNSEASEKASKNAYKSKDYTFPSGKIIHVQGYEPYGLDELIKTEKINEADIITNRTEVPTIWYEDIDGKKHRYFVDIFIPSQKRCIEIKSTWTMKKKHDNILEKQEAMKKAGYQCEIWVFDGKGKKVECYN